jgi:hypothetical protein
MGRWNLVTTSYKNYKPEMGIAIQTSIGTPKFWRWGSLTQAKVFYPYATFKKHTDKTWTQKANIYCDSLDAYASQIEKMLDSFTAIAGDKPLVLMCYEDVHAGEVCHRRWLAEWFRTRYNVDVPEISMSKKQEKPKTNWTALSLF